jgi:hypothetical protein
MAIGSPASTRDVALAALLIAGLLPAIPAAAEELRFGPDLQEAGWTAVTFPGIAPATFKAASRTRLEVSADSAAGLLLKDWSGDARHARRARWRWRVHESGPATDLTQRGADDRALGVYFIFGAASDAGKSATTLLGAPSVTALVYVFGGNKPRGTVLPSPHMERRGKFVVLRHADAEKAVWHSEDVDLAKDYRRAFGQAPVMLLAVGIMSDSDNTRTRNLAELDALTLD